MLKKLAAFLSAILICLIPISAVNAVGDYSADDIANVIEEIISYKENKLGASSKADLIEKLSQNTDSYETQWYLIALSKYGVNVSTASIQTAMKSSALKLYSQNSKATDFQRTTLALYACGLDPQNIGGKNILADAAYNSDLTEKQGINAYAYALIALDCENAVIPDAAKYTRNYFIDKILSLQLPNGGFAISGTKADADVTAICVQALSSYTSQSSVQTAVNSAVSCLCEMQNSNSTFSSFAIENAESTAQVISALIALDINPASDSRFIKGGINPVEALLTFQCSDGGFAHLSSGKSNAMATYQSLNALVDYYVYLKSGNAETFDFNNGKSFDSSSKTSIDSKPSTQNSNNSNKKNESAEENPAISEQNTAGSTALSSTQSTENSQPADSTYALTSGEAFISEKSGNFVPIPTTEPVKPKKQSGFTVWDAGILFYTSTTVLALVAGYLIIYKAKFLKNSGWHRKIEPKEEENDIES